MNMRLSMMLLLMSNLAVADLSVLTVSKQQGMEWLTLDGRIEAVNQSTVSARTSGAVTDVKVDINDQVMAGDVLIQLDDQAQRAGLQEARALLARAIASDQEARLQMERHRQLFQQKSIAKGELERITALAVGASASVEGAKARVKLAEEQLSHTQIKAPYNGIVRNRLVEVGETVHPGSALMTGLSLEALRVVSHLPQRFVDEAHPDLGFRVIYNNMLLEGRSVMLFPYADTSSHSFRIRADIDNPEGNLLPGMWVKVQVPLGDSNRVLIPGSALMQKGALSQVYVMHDDKFRLRLVRTGRFMGDRVEILSGLREGEQIAQDAYAVLAEQEAR